MLIAQLTDFHATVAGRKVGGEVDTRAAFQALLGRLREIEPRPDLLVISGDLAEEGVEAEYAFVLEGLNAVGIPFLAVPGNHDRRDPMRRVLADHVGTKANHLGVVRDFDGLRVIGLDTLVEGHGHGALPPAQIHWLEGVLGTSDGRPTLVVMHHPPFPTGLPAMDEIGLIEGNAELGALLRGREDIAGIVCGHVHRAISGTFAGHRAAIAPSASHQFALDFAGPGFRVVREPTQIALHRIVDGRLVSYLVPGPAA